MSRAASFDPIMLEKLGRHFDKAATTCHTREEAARFIAAQLLADGYAICRVSRGKERP